MTERGTGAGGLAVGYVPDLDSVLPAVTEYLGDRQGRDLFETDHIIVPNAGVRAWLLQHIAGLTGCTTAEDGTSRADGVAMNVSIGYLGALDGFCGRERGAVDPWDVEHLTVSVLGVIARPDPQFADQVERLGGGLKAARAIADRFDRYNARRPAMVEEWEKGNAVLSPEVGVATGDPDHAGEHLVNLPPLPPEDMWQFELWRRVRAEVGSEPWPVVVRRIMSAAGPSDASSLPSRLLVVGLQSLSVRHSQALLALSRWIPVRVVMVHPSPVLASRWAASVAAVPVTPGIAPLRNPDERFDDSVDPLVESWLRGAREVQSVLASQGIEAELPGVPESSPGMTLLDRVKATVLTGTATATDLSPSDMSLRIHRAHNLARQVEVVRDAVLHAMVDLENLEPHEVVILCADIAAAAPLVKAVFAKEYVINGVARKVPVVVADRSLRQVDPGSQLLADVLRAVRGRFPVSDVLAVATSPVVARNFQTGSDDVAAWLRFIDNAVVRWGLDEGQRARRGVSLDVPAHTWSLAIERALLGAVLDDGPPQPELGGVVPMVDLDSADVRPVSVLARIVSTLGTLDETTVVERTVAEWCEAVEDALCDLGDPSTGQLDDALGAIASMATAFPAAGDQIPVRFDHFADLLAELVEQAPGRQPLRTGAVTATSMIPLRGVPFRVVCLVGFDEGTGAAGDAEGDDLSERQRFVGDIDPRLDGRRAILDAVCAAAERVVITCNGRNIKDNKELPLVTPLAELVDLSVRCGVRMSDGVPEIEHHHPRHFLSPRNFAAGGVVPGVVWSHDAVTAAAVGKSVAAAPAQPVAASAPAPPVADIPFTRLERLRSNPLRTFLNDGLRVDTWKEEPEDETATVPLTVEKKGLTALVQDLVVARQAGFTDAQWRDVQETTGNLPIGEYKGPVAAHATTVVDNLEGQAAGWGFALDSVETLAISVPVGASTVTGAVQVHRTTENRIVFNPFMRGARELSVDAAALVLLGLRASGQDFDGALVLSHNTKDAKAQVRFVDLDGSITASVAAARVAQLVGLLHRAEVEPFPMFGTTWQLLSEPDQDAAIHEFDKYLRTEHYPMSPESLLYGPRPRFRVVYPDGGAVRQFFADLEPAVPGRDTAAAKAAGSVRPPNKSGIAKTLSTRYVFA